MVHFQTVPHPGVPLLDGRLPRTAQAGAPSPILPLRLLFRVSSSPPLYTNINYTDGGLPDSVVVLHHEVS